MSKTFKEILPPILVFILFFIICFLLVFSLRFIPLQSINFRNLTAATCTHTTDGYKIEVINDGDYDYHIEITDENTKEIVVNAPIEYPEQLYLTSVVEKHEAFIPNDEVLCKLDVEERDFGILIGEAFLSVDEGETFINLIPNSYPLSYLSSQYCTQGEICNYGYVAFYKSVEFKDDYVEAVYLIEKQPSSGGVEETFDSVIRHEYKNDAKWEFIGRLDD